MRIPFLSEASALRIATAGAVLLGLLGGALAERRPGIALVLCVVVAAVLAVAMLGDRAFAWALVLVAVAPWYPFIAEAAEAPVVRQKVLCAAIAAAPLLPWLWSLAQGGRRTRPGRGALLMGVLYAGMAILIYVTLGSVSAMIGSGIVGFLFAGVTFLCARRFGAGRGWSGAAFCGLLALCAMGADAYLRAPAQRVGYFAGYPITYGALVVGLLPLALLFAHRRSRLLAAGLAAGAAAVLIFSESRSSWVAAAVILIVVVLLQARAGNVRALGGLAAVLVILATLILGTGSLHRIVEQKLSARVQTTSSVTHRLWSYGYAVETIGRQPLFGAGAPGFSARESNNKTSIGAIDNGYLSIAVDMGLVGLIAALIPIAIALRVIARCLRFGLTPQYELAFALGILGMAVVTLFYDSFYWAQIDLLLGAMGGLLSTRLALIARPEAERVRRSAPRLAGVRLAS
ncbi:MAG TPA: O-antigen ligase family protein [Solirubrobacteraceae bacterium]|nr:O-antigen ligase family protein [Solirubrobacteraceae bacterium]